MPAAVVKDGTVTPKFRQGKISPPFLMAKFSPGEIPPPPVREGFSGCLVDLGDAMGMPGKGAVPGYQEGRAGADRRLEVGLLSVGWRGRQTSPRAHILSDCWGPGHGAEPKQAQSNLRCHPSCGRTG